MGRRDKREAVDQQKKDKTKDPLLVVAEKIRDHKELESRWAVLQDTRVEFVRGKDLVEFLKKNPQVAHPALPSDQADSFGSPEEEVPAMLLASRLMVRCDRAVKTIRPGKKKLSRWPGRLDLHADQSFALGDTFYAWTFERPQPIWQTALSIFLPVLTLACCLFPVSPYWCKLAVFYTLIVLLSAMLGLILARWVIFLPIWLLTGRRVMFFPSLLAEEATLSELFRFWPDKDEKPPSKLITRFAATLIVCTVVWFLAYNAPDASTRDRYKRKVTNIIDEVLMWHPAMLAAKDADNSASVNDTNSSAFDAESTGGLLNESADSEPKVERGKPELDPVAAAFAAAAAAGEGLFEDVEEGEAGEAGKHSGGEAEIRAREGDGEGETSSADGDTAAGEEEGRSAGESEGEGKDVERQSGQKEEL